MSTTRYKPAPPPVALLDVAFAQAQAGAGTPEHHRAAKQALAERFPQYGRSQIGGAYRAAQGLLKACYAVGEACRHDALSRPAAEARLAAQFPGFSAAVYRFAVGYGMFISR